MWKLTGIISIFIFFTNVSFSNETTDWRKDQEAFKSFRLLEEDELRDSRNFFTEHSNEEIQISSTFLKDKLSEFTGAKEIIIDGKKSRIKERKSSKGKEMARKYLRDEFINLGYKIKNGVFRRGENFIAERPGKDSEKFLILSSHIDSVGNAGANDDGSGTIATLAVAKALANQNFKYSIRIIGFDLEEKGLVGSREYTKSLRNKKNIIGVIHLEMMATNSRKDGAFHLIDCDKKNSKFLTKSIVGAIDKFKIPLKITKACTKRSDHSNFWQARIPAVVLSENFFGGDGDRCYHKRCDQVDSRLDFEYMAKITKSVAYGVRFLLSPLN